MKFSDVAESFDKIEKTSGRLDMMALLAELFKIATPEEIAKLVYLSQGALAPPFEGLEVGMGEKFVIKSIALATGYDNKIVLKKYKKSGDLGTTAEELVENRQQQALVSEPLTFQKVFSTFTKIATMSGHGTQDKKINSLADLLNSATPIEARYIVRFPIGKLRLGAGDSTILEALSISKEGDRTAKEPLERAYNLCSDLGLIAEKYFKTGLDGIKKFEIELFHPVRPALAERLPTAEEIIEKMKTCAVEAKYDGLRMQIHKQGKHVEIYSRRLEKMTHMFPEIVVAVNSQIKAKDAIFEGEALAVNEITGEFYPFQTTIQRKRKHGVGKMSEDFPLRIFAFDLLYLDGKDMTKAPYAERRAKLESMIDKTVKDVRILPSERIVTSDANELQRYFDASVQKGLEGIIAKDLKSEYVAGARKFAWIKLKRSYKGELADTVDVVIVGYFVGRGQRAEFGFGGFLGAVYDENEDRFKTITKVGTGINEEQMVSFKKMLDLIRVKEKPNNLDSNLVPDVWVMPKYVVTLTADEITRSPMHTAGMENGTGYALRFPRLKGGVREDKGPFEATTVGEIIEMFHLQKRNYLEESVLPKNE